LRKTTLASIATLTIILFLFFTVLSTAGCSKTTPKQLSVYVWEGYLPEKAADLFEQETGIKLNIVFISDYNKTLTFLKGGGQADIVMPTHSQAIRYYEDDLVQPLDLQIIKNYENVFKLLREQEWTKWDGQEVGSGEVYAVPYVFGTSGIVINTSKYTKNLDNIGWEVFFDNDLKGRVTAKNGIASLWMILDVCGIDRENLLTDTDGTLEQIRDKTITLKNNVLKFYETNVEVMDLMKNEEVWVAHIEDANGRILSQFDSKFVYLLPDTGLAWIDTFMIPKVAANTAGANLFIDFMLRPDIAAMLTDQSGFKTTVEDALNNTKGIDKDLYSFTEDQLEKFLWTPNMSEEVRYTTSEFWEELTAIQ